MSPFSFSKTDGLKTSLKIHQGYWFLERYLKLTHPLSTAKSSNLAGSTLHPAHYTVYIRTTPAPANAPESDHVHFILNIEGCTLHTNHFCCSWQIYHFTLQTSNICLSWSQYLHGKMYLDPNKKPYSFFFFCIRETLNISMFATSSTNIQKYKKK